MDIRLTGESAAAQCIHSWLPRPAGSPDTSRQLLFKDHVLLLLSYVSYSRARDTVPNIDIAVQDLAAAGRKY